MASNAPKIALAQFVKRGFAAQAAVSPVESSISPPDVNCTVMPNKLLVSSLDLNGPLSRMSVVFRVGARNETAKNLGTLHIIRSMAGFSTERCSGFAVVRNIQQSGAHFTCTGDREITAFNVVAPRNKINCTLSYLSAVVSCPSFKHWEVQDNFSRLQYEIGCLSPQSRLIDILHKTAFRTGLGNSLFIKKDNIGMHTSQMLRSFYSESFTANRASVVGYNLGHKDVLEFAKSLDLHCNDIPEGNSVYYGGEMRKDKNSYFAHVAVGTQSVGSKDLKESLVYSVLQYAYGVSPSVAWGGSTSPLYKATYPIAPDAGVSCFNFNYSDNGLFGVCLSGSAATVGKALKAAFKVLKSGSVTEGDVKRAKAMLKMNILYSWESAENMTSDMGVQSLYGGVIIPAPVLAQAVDKISFPDVSAAAKKIAAGKFSLVGFGNLTEVPYLDELQ